MRVIILLCIALSGWAQTHLPHSQIDWVMTPYATRVLGAQLTARSINTDFLNTLECYDTANNVSGVNVWLFQNSLLYRFLRFGWSRSPSQQGWPAERCPDGLMWGDSPMTPKSDSEITPCVATRLHVRQIWPVYLLNFQVSCSHPERWTQQ